MPRAFTCEWFASAPVKAFHMERFAHRALETLGALPARISLIFPTPPRRTGPSSAAKSAGGPTNRVLRELPKVDVSQRVLIVL